MSLSLEKILEIRRLYFDLSLKKVEIVRIVHVSRPTIDKYLKMEDFNVPDPVDAKTQEDPEGVGDPDNPGRQKKPSILDPFKSIILTLLMSGKDENRKMRASNIRIFEILKDEHGYTGSRSTVDNYLRPLRAELGIYKKKDDGEGYLPLTHYPGEVQVDFGKVIFVEAGIRKCGSFLVMTFPQSNARYARIVYGENIECTTEALVDIFGYVGGVPREIWFDNASSIVKLLNNGKDRRVSEHFKRFAAHYGFRYVFMQPKKGNQKGSVENAVGYIRNHLLVPARKFDSLEEGNKVLLAKCDELLEEEHYRFGVPVKELFKADKEALLPLPSTPFCVSRTVVVVADKCGMFELENGNHRYSSAPNCAGQPLSIRLTSGTVEVFDREGRTVVTHPRLYGGDGEKMERIDYIPYLKYIARKPNAFRNTPLKEVMPARLAVYIESLSNTERGKLLEGLDRDVAERGFQKAVESLAERLDLGDGGDPESPGAFRNGLGIPDMESPGGGLGQYDDIL